MITISYNGFNDIFSGLAPAPLISKTTENISYGTKWGQVENLTLNGNLTGRCLDYTGAIFLHQRLVQRFNKDFQPFVVKEDNNIIYSGEITSVQQINFPENKFVNLVPFSIDLKCYSSHSFSGTFGILEPKDEFNFSESEDNTVEIRHSISARGFNTSLGNSDAFENARSFVAARTGWTDQITPHFINYVSTIEPVLINIEETPDRFNGTYSVEETYTSDKTSAAVGLMRYSIQSASGLLGGAVTVGLEGQIIGGLNYDISDIRSRFNATDFYALASTSYANNYNESSSDLNSTELTKRITENLLNNTISFSFSYDNDPSSNPFLDYTTKFDEDLITYNVQSTIEGSVRGRGDRSVRWENVQNYYNQIKNSLFGRLSDDYSDQNFKYSLNPNIVSKTETFDPFAAVISFSYVYDSSPIVNSSLEFLKYTVNVQPGINIYSEAPLLNRQEYYIQDLEYKRRSIVTIQGSAKIKNNVGVTAGIQVIKDQVNALISRYTSGGGGISNAHRTLDEQNFVQGTDSQNRFVTFSVTFSSDDGRGGGGGSDGGGFLGETIPGL